MSLPYRESAATSLTTLRNSYFQGVAGRQGRADAAGVYTRHDGGNLRVFRSAAAQSRGRTQDQGQGATKVQDCRVEDAGGRVGGVLKPVTCSLNILRS